MLASCESQITACLFLLSPRILMAKGWDGMKRKHSKNVGAEGRKKGRRGIFLRRGAMECKSAVSQNWPTALFVLLFSVIAVDDLRGSMAAVDIQLAVDLLGIVIDCVFGNDKDLGNIPVAVAATDQVQNLQFSGSELGEGRIPEHIHRNRNYIFCRGSGLRVNGRSIHLGINGGDFTLEGMDQIGCQMPVDHDAHQRDG